MTYDAEHLFVCLFAVCMYLIVSVQVFGSFLNVVDFLIFEF